MTLDELRDELLDKVTAASRTTMVGDHAIPFLVGAELVKEAVMRAHAIGRVEGMNAFAPDRLQLACTVLSGMGGTVGAMGNGDVAHALDLVDHMIDLVTGGR